MTIRQNIPKTEPGIEQLPNGYAGSDQPSDYQIPSCGIADVDESVFRLFDEELGFSSQKLIVHLRGKFIQDKCSKIGNKIIAC